MKVTQIHNHQKPIPKLHIWNLLGKKVLSHSGEYSGRLVNAYFQSGSISGILVFYRWQLYYLDSSFIQNTKDLDSQTCIVLNDNPFYLLRGKIAMDSHGKILGKVSKVEQMGQGNDFHSIYVKKKFYTSPIPISKKQIASIQKNIFLK